MTPQEHETLRALLVKHGAPTILQTLSALCAEKAEEARIHWSDGATGRDKYGVPWTSWRGAASIIETASNRQAVKQTHPFKSVLEA